MSWFCCWKVTLIRPTFDSKKKMEPGKLIRELRTRKGMTQEELAEKTEVSARTIQRIENGEVDPRAYTLQMIAKALEVDFSMFVEGESDESREVKRVSDINWLGLLHLSGMIPVIVPTVLIWNSKKDEIKGISDHYRSVITFQLMIIGAILGCLWIYYKTGMLIPLIGLLLGNGLFALMNTIKVMSGEPQMKMPFSKKETKT